MTAEIDFTQVFPREMVGEIFSYLDPRELSRTAQVSKTWNQFANDEKHWKRFCLPDELAENVSPKAIVAERLAPFPQNLILRIDRFVDGLQLFEKGTIEFKFSKYKSKFKVEFLAKRVNEKPVTEIKKEVELDISIPGAYKWMINPIEVPYFCTLNESFNITCSSSINANTAGDIVLCRNIGSKLVVKAQKLINDDPGRNWKYYLRRTLYWTFMCVTFPFAFLGFLIWSIFNLIQCLICCCIRKTID